jgi:hypothetical protein
MADQPMMARLGEAIACGDRDATRSALEALWEELGEHGGPLHRCAVAHHLADLQDAAHDELAWDLRALAAAGELTDDQLTEAGVAGPVPALLPSLHLNVAEAYRQTGDVAAARRHLAHGEAAAYALAADGYGMTIRRGLQALAARLGLPRA